MSFRSSTVFQLAFIVFLVLTSHSQSLGFSQRIEEGDDDAYEGIPIGGGGELSETLFLGTVDGKLVAIDVDSGKMLWEFNSGNPVVSDARTDFQKVFDTRTTATATVAVDDDDDADVPELVPMLNGDRRLLVVAGDSSPGSVRKVQPLSLGVRDIAMSDKVVSAGDMLFYGSKHTHVFVMDARTGTLLHEEDVVTAESEDDWSYGGEAKEVLVMGRNDFEIRAVEVLSGKARYNVSVGEYTLQLFGQEYRERSAREPFSKAAEEIMWKDRKKHASLGGSNTERSDRAGSEQGSDSAEDGAVWISLDGTLLAHSHWEFHLSSPVFVAFRLDASNRAIYRVPIHFFERFEGQPVTSKVVVSSHGRRLFALAHDVSSSSAFDDVLKDLRKNQLQSLHTSDPDQLVHFADKTNYLFSLAELAPPVQKPDRHSSILALTDGSDADNLCDIPNGFLSLLADTVDIAPPATSAPRQFLRSDRMYIALWRAVAVSDTLLWILLIFLVLSWGGVLGLLVMQSVRQRQMIIKYKKLKEEQRHKDQMKRVLNDVRDYVASHSSSLSERVISTSEGDGVETVTEKTNSHPSRQSSPFLGSMSNSALPRSGWATASGLHLNGYQSRYQNDYKELGKLGHGGFGTVFRARNILDGKEYAMKKIYLRPHRLSIRIIRETRVLARLDHRNVVRYYQSWIEPYMIVDQSILDTFTRALRDALTRDDERRQERLKRNAENHSKCNGETVAPLSSPSTQTGRTSNYYADVSDETTADTQTDRSTTQSGTSVSVPPSAQRAISSLSRSSSIPGAPQFPASELSDIIQFESQGSRNSFSTESMTTDRAKKALNVSGRTASTISEGSDSSGSWSEDEDDDDGDTTSRGADVEESLGSLVQFDPMSYSINVPKMESSSSVDDDDDDDDDDDEDDCSGESEDATVLMPSEDEGSQDLDDKVKTAGGCVILYIQMQLCRADTLRQWLDGPKRSTSECKRVVVDIARGLQHIHRLGLVHRDLKPSNVFAVDDYEGNTTWKLGDFGLSRPMHSLRRLSMRTSTSDSIDNELISWTYDESTVDGSTKGHIGTPAYAAPEQWELPSEASGTTPAVTVQGFQVSQRMGRTYAWAADMYSLGVILVELFSNFNSRMERSHCLQSARDAKLPFEKRWPTDMQRTYPRWCKLCERLLQLDPQQRPTASELLEDPLLVPVTPK